MNVKELKELLNNFPDEMEVVVWDLSDDACYDYMEVEKAEIVTGIRREGSIMQEGSIINPYTSDFGISRDLIKSYLLIGY